MSANPYTIVQSNIKSQTAPFVLNPQSALFSRDEQTYKNSTGVQPQFFTFRPDNIKNARGNYGLLNFCPQTFIHGNYFSTDISYNQIFTGVNGAGTDKTAPIFQTILNSIPGVMIREYIPDTALQQLINLFYEIALGVKRLLSGNSGIKLDKDKPVNEDDSAFSKIAADVESDINFSKMFKKLTNVMMWILQYVTGVGDVNFVTELCKATEEQEFRKRAIFNDIYSTIETTHITQTNTVSSQSTRKTTGHWYGDDVGPWVSSKNSSANTNTTNTAVSTSVETPYRALIDMPFMLYYQLQSCTTTGIFEIPCIKTDNLLYSSDGHPGWNGKGSSGFRFLPESLTSLPGIGTVIGHMFGNIGISWTPWWNAAEGNATPEKDVVITFDLYNDTSEAALINFIFINTIIPNNKWVQYGLFQHSSHIYDVRLEGYNRLFACSGNFDVKYKGILRDPPGGWFEHTSSLYKYISNSIGNKKEFLDRCKTNKLIKIPDIYEVTMTFKSLLPTNFNQYLYTYIANDNSIKTYSNSIYDKSIMLSAIKNAVKGLFKGAKEQWNKDPTQQEILENL